MEALETPKSEVIDQILDWLLCLGGVRAALELQIWQKIDLGADTAEELASQEGWNPTGTRALLDTICALKLLTRVGNRYCLVPESDCYLIPGKPTYKGGLVLGEYNWEGNGRLADAIRSGTRRLAYDATTADVAGVWIADYSRRWVYPEKYFEIDEELWRSVEIQACDGLRVMDLACGPAPVSLALARQHPGVHLTWLDWEEVLQTAIKVADGLGIANQVSLLPGDLWDVDLGSNCFDAAYLGNVTHFFSPEENTRLLRRVNAALTPKGAIVVNSAVRRESEWASAALWLYAATASGGAYDFAEYKTMLERANFVHVKDVNQGPIRAVKP